MFMDPSPDAVERMSVIGLCARYTRYTCKSLTLYAFTRTRI